ncbi:CRISPR-associated endoribonuclease Cas6 [Acidianus sp. HS-5]|uniref:CRISPR-associated endoribonuclease Cas6 n=1 Tax=Acidianus sp. HS-5 TaxID=2886040 RepID=UPI001F006076|nr:CRISPR-associated endoribonuclease Cas6 [Acidianus sp. HS-5]BDC18756.1 CRISPR-associated endoribonuclease Cas6 [Acidianus sp. HS-5]
MIYVATFKLKADHDVVLPPFTSKVSKSILAYYSPTYTKLSEDAKPFKPIRVTVLKDSKGVVLAVNGRKAMMKGGGDYYFSFTFTDNNILKDLMGKVNAEVEMWGAKIEADIIDLKVIDEVKYEDSTFYKVNFLTPTLIQPPKKVKENRFLLYPYSYFFLASIVRHWNANMDKKVNITFLKSFVYLKEVDHGIRPVSANYDGKPVRGFWGWIIYEVREKKVKELLSYANLFGVGKSRAIGFGEVKVIPVSFEKS